MRKATLCFLVCFITRVGLAQQDPMYSMYMFDKMLINPAFAGSSHWVVASVKYRDKLSGLNGRPSTQTFNIHSPIQKKHIGVGFKVVKDKIAILSTLNAAVNFSYHLNVAGGKLSAGLEIGVYNRKIDYQKLIYQTRGDELIPFESQSSTIPDAAWGLYYQKKQYYFGFSKYHLIKSTFKDGGVANSNSKLYNHFYLLAGNVFMINKYWTIEPSMLLKIQPSSAVQLDVNSMVYYQEKFGIGLQYRTGDAIVGILRINILENLKLSYSYDYILSKLSKYTQGGHEILLSYGIKLAPPPVQKETHPRYYF